MELITIQTLRISRPNLNIYLRFSFYNTALLELSKPITFNQYIQPIQLTTVCDTPHMGGVPVVAAGTGRTELDKPPSDYLIRHAQLTTISSELCATRKLYEKNPLTVICVYETPVGGQAAFKGDSGI